MQVSTLLKQAGKCKSDEAASKLLNRLTEAFQVKKSRIAHLDTANEESVVEDDGAFVRVEFNRVISNDYITMIRPEIRDGKMSVVVITNRMTDGMGMQSQDWEVASVEGEELEDEVEVDEDDDVLHIAEQAAELAIQHHRELIEQVGVPHKIAAKTAQECWENS